MCPQVKAGTRVRPHNVHSESDDPPDRTEGPIRLHAALKTFGLLTWHFLLRAAARLTGRSGAIRRMRSRNPVPDPHLAASRPVLGQQDPHRMPERRAGRPRPRRGMIRSQRTFVGPDGCCRKLASTESRSARASVLHRSSCAASSTCAVLRACAHRTALAVPGYLQVVHCPPLSTQRRLARRTPMALRTAAGIWCSKIHCELSHLIAAR